MIKRTSKNWVKILLASAAWCVLFAGNARVSEPAVDARYHWEVEMVPSRSPLYGSVKGIEIDSSADSIGVFGEKDPDICLGSGAFIGDSYLLSAFRAIEADPDKEGDYADTGFKTGDKVYFKLHKASTGQEYPLKLADGKDYYTYKYTDNGDEVRVDLFYESSGGKGAGTGSAGGGNDDGEGGGEDDEENAKGDGTAGAGGLPAWKDKETASSKKTSGPESSWAGWTGDGIYYYGPEGVKYTDREYTDFSRPYTQPREVRQKTPKKLAQVKTAEPTKPARKLEKPRKEEVVKKAEPDETKPEPKRRSKAPAVLIFLAVASSLGVAARKIGLV